MAVSLLLAALLAVTSRHVNVPLTPLRPFPISSLRGHNSKYVIAAAPPYWTDGIETELALQSGSVDLSKVTAEWFFDNSHVVWTENLTSVNIYTTLRDYSGHNSPVTITCWVTVDGGLRERIRALMDIIVLGDATTSTSSSSVKMEIVTSTHEVETENRSLLTTKPAISAQPMYTPVVGSTMTARLNTTLTSVVSVQRQ